jgi:hypothetical protein
LSTVLQAKQSAWHGPLQHTPSMQNPETQSAFPLQVWPFCSLQSPAPLHALFPEHTGTALASERPLVTNEEQEPAEFLHDLQVVVHASWQQVPSTQKPELHTLHPCRRQSTFAVKLQGTPAGLRAAH